MERESLGVGGRVQEGKSMIFLKREIDYQRRRYLRSERIAEIREVKDALVYQGFHPHVSRTVARWFRRKGFNIDGGRGGWFVVRSK